MVTDRIASFDWDLEESKAHHLVLSKEMNAEVEVMKVQDEGFVARDAVGTIAV